MSFKIFLAIILVSAQLSGYAYAEHRDVEVKPIQVTGLKSFKGHKLSLFLVNAHRAPIGVPGSRLVVHAVVGHPRTMTIDGSGVAEFPGFEVKRREGFFNNVAFVVHPMGKNEVFIRNPDGELAEDPRLGSTRPETAVTGEQMGAIYIDTLKKLQGKGQTKLPWTNLINGS